MIIIISVYHSTLIFTCVVLDMNEECIGGTVTLNQGNCPSADWAQIGQSCYQLVQQASDFTTAQQGCVSLNARLAWVDTRYKLCRLGEMIDTVKGSPREVFFWVGGIRIPGGGDVFHWVEPDGTTLGKID